MADLNYPSPTAPHYSNTAILDGNSVTLCFPKHPPLLFKTTSLGTEGGYLALLCCGEATGSKS